MSAYSTWLPGTNWLYGTYSGRYGRQFQVGSTADNLDVGGTMQLAALIGHLDNALVANHAPDWRCGVADAALGTIRIYGSPAAQTLTAVDRLLFALGYDTDCGEVLPAATEFVTRCPSPLAIPLQSCEAVKVDRELERQFKLDSFRRGHGDPYGKTDIWRFSVVLDSPALRALKAGYCQGGRVMVSPFNLSQHIALTATAWAPGAPGYIEGQMLGFEAGAWLDPTTRQFYRSQFLVATAVV